MPNQNYSEFKKQNEANGPGYTYRKGEQGAEHDPAHKDTPKAWPKAGGPRSPSLNSRVKFPVIKTRVVVDGVDGGAH